MPEKCPKLLHMRCWFQIQQETRNARHTWKSSIGRWWVPLCLAGDFFLPSLQIKFTIFSLIHSYCRKFGENRNVQSKETPIIWRGSLLAIWYTSLQSFFLCIFNNRIKIMLSIQSYLLSIIVRARPIPMFFKKSGKNRWEHTLLESRNWVCLFYCSDPGI